MEKQVMDKRIVNLRIGGRRPTKASVRTAVALAVASAIAEAVFASGAARAAAADSAPSAEATAARSTAGKPTAKASKQETTGVVTGLLVGAAAGGPVGAIFGAAAGGWLGDRYHRKDEERRALAANLDASEGRRSQLGIEMQRLNAQLAESESRSSRFGATVEMSHDLETTVEFRTADATLREDAALALQKLGALLATLPDAKARVAGFADARGPERFNLELSRRRANAVAAALEAGGVERDRLIIEAYGKSAALADPGDTEGNAFERRVTVTVEPAMAKLARVE
jgi:outer membrane protein OmpA-like peptidoglycan-associated protein